jgi:Tol biopolymer transport system component
MKRIALLVAAVALCDISHAADPAPGAFELALIDMQGHRKVLGTLPASVFAPRVSPDGRRVAFELADAPATANQPQPMTLYVAELDNLDKRRALQPSLTTLRNLAPVWSADGDWIVFLASGNGPDSLFRQRADGSIQPRFLVDGRAPEGLYKDGRLSFITRRGDRDYGISVMDLATMKVTARLDQPDSDQHSARISPDGHWIAYASTETGRQEVWLEPLPQTAQRVQLTRQGGRHPMWSPDGRQVYFDQDGRMYRMDVLLDGETPRAGEAVALPIAGFQQGPMRRQFDLMPDGQAFVMLFPVSATAQ